MHDRWSDPGACWDVKTWCMLGCLTQKEIDLALQLEKNETDEANDAEDNRLDEVVGGHCELLHHLVHGLEDPG